MSVRLSELQRTVLERIAQHEAPTEEFPNGVPLYVGLTFMCYDFDTEGESNRWLKKLETRGFIQRTGPGGCFLRLTDAGRAALKGGA